MSLSEKIFEMSNLLHDLFPSPYQESWGTKFLFSRDVREAVKELKETFCKVTKELGFTPKDYCLSLKDINGFIDEIFGEKLV